MMCSEVGFLRCRSDEDCAPDIIVMVSQQGRF